MLDSSKSDLVKKSYNLFLENVSGICKSIFKQANSTQLLLSYSGKRRKDGVIRKP